MADGPMHGLSLPGGTGCPAPHWNMEHCYLLLDFIRLTSSTRVSTGSRFGRNAE